MAGDRAPAFLCAYANDRVDDRRYLRNLAEEKRAIRAALRPAVDAGLVTPVECPDATVADVLDECQHHAAELTVFHFAGHSDARTLVFERPSGAAHRAGAESVARFLGTLGGLKLAVLNGCSTEQQAQMLLDCGVPCVVTTSTQVRDEVAARFASRLYASLARGTTIAKAFAQASTAVAVEFDPGDPAHLVRALPREVGGAPDPSIASLWGLHGELAATKVRLVSRWWRWLRRARWAAAFLAVAAAAVSTYETWFAARTSTLDLRVHALEVSAADPPQPVQGNSDVQAIVATAATVEGSAIAAAASRDPSSVTLSGGFHVIRLDPTVSIDPRCRWVFEARREGLGIERTTPEGANCPYDLAIRADGGGFGVVFEGMSPIAVPPHETLRLHTRGAGTTLRPRGERLVVFRPANRVVWKTSRLAGTADPGERITLPGASHPSDAFELAGDIALYELTFDRAQLRVLGAVARARGMLRPDEPWRSDAAWQRPWVDWPASAGFTGLAVALWLPARRRSPRRTEAS